MRLAACWLLFALVALVPFAGCEPRGPGEDAGCLDEGDASALSCAAAEACGAFVLRRCEGDSFVSDCRDGEPVLLSCGAQAGACEDGLGCISSADGYCDELDFFCEDGLTCRDFLCE